MSGPYSASQCRSGEVDPWKVIGPKLLRWPEWDLLTTTRKRLDYFAYLIYYSCVLRLSWSYDDNKLLFLSVLLSAIVKVL